MLRLNRKLRIFLVIFAILGIIRVILPSVAKTVINNRLQEVSPSISAHVNDVDLAIIRGSYTLKGITAHIKKNKKQILAVESVNASLLWKDLFSGLISSNIVIRKAQMNITPSLIPAIKEHLAKVDVTEEVKEEARRYILKLPRIDLIDSSVTTDYFPALTKKEGILMTGINGRVTNLIPTVENQLSPFNLQGTILGTGEMKLEGEMDLYGKAPKWSVDSEILHFDMTTLNKFLKEKVPLTFTKGEIDLYAEAKSEGGPVTGYMKPFVKGLDVIKSDEEFKNTGHWFIEIISALSNITLEAEEVVATKIPFSYDKEFKVDTGETIEKAITHGFSQQQSRGIENSIDLKQAQEEK